MLQKRFFLPYCLVLACTLLALLSLLPSTASAASTSRGSAHSLHNHQSLTAPAKVKPFINQVNCAGRDDFVKVWTFPSNPTDQGICFANDGFTNPGFLIQNVQLITSGNNCVVISDRNGDSFPAIPPHGAFLHFIANLTFIDIVGRSC